MGVLGGLAVRRMLAAMLFGIGPNDPATVAGAIAGLLAVAAAAFLPARRHARRSMVALREDRGRVARAGRPGRPSSERAVGFTPRLSKSSPGST